MERFVEVTGYGQRVSVQNGWLVVRKLKDEEVGRVPLDDLSSLMLINQGLTVSAATLSAK